MDVCRRGNYEKSLDSLSQSTLFLVGKESLHSGVLKGTNSLMCEVAERRMARNMPE